ncbi:MAG: hypothetical protein OCD76_23940 [Reichenbachiella sp.]
MRKLSTESERIEWISQWESSGKSQVDWCKTQELSLHTFRKWVSNYHKEQKSKEETSSKFIPLTATVQETAVSSPFELVYPNGVQLRIPADITANQLKTFIHLYD